MEKASFTGTDCSPITPGEARAHLQSAGGAGSFHHFRGGRLVPRIEEPEPL